MKKWLTIIPAPVLVLSLALALTQPLIGLWLACAPPAGYVATGLHIPDSSLFLQSMRMFFNGFESQYATCQAAATSGIRFYPLPHLWLYGVLGAVARLAGVTDFAMYFIGNGAGAFVYLLAVYFFLREVAGLKWRLPFALFCLSGGLGGVLYLASRVLGLHEAAGFTDYFWRFGLYELFEGAHLQPVLYFPRLYYTLSLALCLAALTLLIKGRRQNDRRLLALAGLLFLPGMFIDMRYGAFTLALAFLYLWQDAKPFRPFPLAWLAAPGIAGAAAGWLLMNTNAAAIQNHIDVANTAMWLTPFLSVVALHLLVAPRELYRRAAQLPPLEKMLAYGAIGYLGAFVLLFAAYQLYWGNVLIARDAAAALAVSDWAFIGAAVGIALVVRASRLHILAGTKTFDVQAGRTHHNTTRPDWIVLWLLSFLVMSVTAFGGGWWLNFGPQRLQIFLWLPLCMMSASAIENLHTQKPVRANAITVALVFCGVSSLVAAALFFQGPLAFCNQSGGARPPYAGYHAEIMTVNDAAAISAIGEGIVLAPNLAADVVALNRPNRVVWGTGSFNMSDQPYAAMETDVARFFTSGAKVEWRRAFIEKWCVAWVYCPETWPIPASALEELRALPFLEETARHGNAVVFRVNAQARAI